MTVKGRQVKKRSCDEEMRLFSDCLVKGEECKEFEERYFACMERACSVCWSFSYSIFLYITAMSEQKDLESKIPRKAE